MAQAVSAAATPRRAVVPPPRQAGKLEGRIVNHFLLPDAREVLEATVHVAEILSFLPPKEVANGALAIVPRQVKHTKLGELFLRSHMREKTRISLQELVELTFYFSKQKKFDVHWLLRTFLKYCPALRELHLERGTSYNNLDFIPGTIRKQCPEFKGLIIPPNTQIESGEVLANLNRRVSLYNMTYQGSYSHSEVSVLSYLETLSVRSTFGPTQSQIDMYGQLPRFRTLSVIVHQYVFNGFLELKTLILNLCSKSDLTHPQFIESLSKLPKLEALQLELVSNDSPLSCLAQLPHLKKLALTGFLRKSAPVSELQKLMQDSPRLTSIIMSPMIIFGDLKGLQAQFPHIALLEAVNNQVPLLEPENKPFFPDLIKPKPAAQAKKE